MDSSSSTTTTDSGCGTASASRLPELTWIFFSFLLYSCVMLYVGYQASRQSYAGNRITGTRLRFPENMTTMLYIWLIHTLGSSCTAFLAYLLGGGWTYPTSVVLSMYLIMEVVHYGWMTSYLRFSAYAKSICMKLTMLTVQTYMLVLYFVLEPAISILYLFVLGVSLYEFLVNLLALFHSCRSHLRVIPQRDHRTPALVVTSSSSSSNADGEGEEDILCENA